MVGPLLDGIHTVLLVGHEANPMPAAATTAAADCNAAAGAGTVSAWRGRPASRAIGQELLDSGGGPFPERLQINALIYDFLLRHVAMVSDWAARAAGQVRDWNGTGP